MAGVLRLFIQFRLNFFTKIPFILDNACYQQFALTFSGYLYGFPTTLVVMYAAEIQQVICRLFNKFKILCIEAIVNSSKIVQFGAAVGIADGHIMPPEIIFFINRDDLRR